MEVFLIRHTRLNIDHGICYGQAEVEVSEDFFEESERIRNNLPTKPGVIYSSPSKRCYQLAKTIYPSKNVIKEVRLLEMNFGLWELKRWEAIPRADIDRWANNLLNAKPPMGESLKDVNKRVMDWWSELLSLNKKTICVFTHGGVIRIIRNHLHGHNLNDLFDSPVIEFGHVEYLDV